MLTNDDVRKIENAVVTAYQKEHTTPSGPFLEILRAFAKAGRLQDMSYAMQYYFTREPARRLFVIGHLPGIIVNHYFPTVPNFNMSKFAKWSIENPEWAAALWDSFNQPPSLESEVFRVIDESQKSDS
jgi:hypothetical protein